MYRIMFKITVALAVMIILPFTAQAERLSKRECKLLQQQRGILVKGGASKNMGRGTKWVKKNLSKPALEDLKQYIEISEKLLFQCGHTTMKHVNLRTKRPARPKKPAKKKQKTSQDADGAPKKKTKSTSSSVKSSANKNSRIATTKKVSKKETVSNNESELGFVGVNF